MKPSILNYYFLSLEQIHGIGKKIYADLQKICGKHLIDLLFHVPKYYKHKIYVASLLHIKPEHHYILPITIHAHHPPARKHLPYKIEAYDCHGHSLNIIYFHVNQKWLQHSYKLEQSYVIIGKIDYYNQQWQMVHPEKLLPASSTIQDDIYEPVYASSGLASSKKIHSYIQQFIHQLPVIPEWLEESVLQQYQLPSFHEALQILHMPNTQTIHLIDVAKKRLALDEATTKQVALRLLRQRQKQATGQCYVSPQNYYQKLLENLSFQPTADQIKAYHDIMNDMEAPSKMIRLLQGDVGCGKTLVCVMAMMNIAELGYQSLLMAPTDVLAKQHYYTIQHMVKTIPINVVLLTGKMTKKEKASAFHMIASHSNSIIIGTHALLYQQNMMNNVGFVVIDEQHRFGVEQRLHLSEHYHHADVLIMSATPIPRTLTMAVFGDIDLSIIYEKPKNRLPIETKILSVDKIPKLIEGLQHKIQQGERIYWVCPLVEESDKLPAISVEERFSYLQKVFPSQQCGLLHGQMKAPEKEKIIHEFSQGICRILCSTSVIEVGIDVPEATIMIIEQAERFGLAQLHQLRGRVGRGDKSSLCFLLYKHPISDTAKQRLNILRQSDNGFIIAEQDLALRGGGDILGIKQSGLPQFHFVNIFEHQNLIDVSKKNTDILCQKPYDLSDSQWDIFNHYLYLYEYHSLKNFLS